MEARFSQQIDEIPVPAQTNSKESILLEKIGQLEAKCLELQNMVSRLDLKVNFVPMFTSADQTITESPPRVDPVTSMHDTSVHNLLYKFGGHAKIPVPKFDPNLDLASQFLDDLEVYMKQLRLAPDDWISQLSLVFSKNSTQALWWKRTRILVKSWLEFKTQFLEMYGSITDSNAALEKLVLKRQTVGQPFETFALETELQYLRVHPKADRDSKDIISFISQRALPELRANLLGCNAQNIYDLIKLAQKIETPMSTGSSKDKPGHPESGSKKNGTKPSFSTFGSNHNTSTNINDKNKSDFFDRNKSPGNSQSGKSHYTSNFPACLYCKRTNHECENCRFKNQNSAEKNSHQAKSTHLGGGLGDGESKTHSEN